MAYSNLSTFEKFQRLVAASLHVPAQRVPRCAFATWSRSHGLRRSLVRSPPPQGLFSQTADTLSASRWGSAVHLQGSTRVRPCQGSRAPNRQPYSPRSTHSSATRFGSRGCRSGRHFLSVSWAWLSGVRSSSSALALCLRSALPAATSSSQRTSAA
eukprot:Amastigsp_a841418_285.p3 type:complete len:156 gc:universal Amastigsp_a841418_285:1204-737(-)